MHTADEMRRMRASLQSVRIKGQVNLILRAPRVAVGERRKPRSQVLYFTQEIKVP